MQPARTKYITFDVEHFDGDAHQTGRKNLSSNFTFTHCSKYEIWCQIKQEEYSIRYMHNRFGWKSLTLVTAREFLLRHIPNQPEPTFCLWCSGFQSCLKEGCSRYDYLILLSPLLSLKIVADVHTFRKRSLVLFSRRIVQGFFRWQRIDSAYNFRPFLAFWVN